MRSRALVYLALIGALVFGSTAGAADGPADWTTTLRVKLVLLEKLGADSLNLEVETDAGLVTLRGTVEKRETQELAETVAKSVEGVRSVRNDVRLEANVANPHKTGVAAGEAEAEVKDAVLATKIRLALADRLGSDGFRISTEVADGVVTLAFERDFAEARRDEAVKVVEGVGGVRKVVAIDKP